MTRLAQLRDIAVSVAVTVATSLHALARQLRRHLAATWIRSMSREELRRLILGIRSGRALDVTGWSMLAGVIDFHAKRAHDVMRPRTDVVALPVDASEPEIRATLQTERYSRYPVYRESLDDVVGVFLAKDLWLHDGRVPFALGAFTREALYVPASRPADQVLADLRKTRAHMAIVLDEYGGTAGLITMEDLIEQVVGDIADEYDPATRRSLEVDGVLELAGSLSLIDVRHEHGLDIPDGEWTTLGGYAFSRLGRLPKIGDRVPYPDGELEIIAIDGRRVAALRAHRNHAAPAPTPA
jgi:CBS domain containing-hemolysin-like protein